MSILRQKITRIITLLLMLSAITACNSLSHSERNINQNNNITTEPVSVAILLPLTGATGKSGQEYNYMIKKGLSDYVQTQIKVLSYDTATDQQLEESIAKVINNKTDIIIGSIDSVSTRHIAKKVKKHNIAVITLSNDPSLADKNLFVLGHAPMRQFEYLIKYLLENDYQNYIIFFPSGRYSKSLASVLQNTIIKNNATMVRTDYYSDDDQNIAHMVKVISDNVDQLNEMDDNMKKPVILLSDDTQTLVPVMTNIVRNNLDKKTLVAGDSRVNIEGFDTLEMIYTGNIHTKYKMIEQDARKHGINHIGFMHTIAYDAGSLVASCISRSPFSKHNFLNKMHNVSNFNGLSGIIDFQESIAQRKYQIIKRQENGN